MAINLSVLRSQLQYVCSEELKNITTIELEECKWTTKKKIFSSLIALCPNLADKSSEIYDIVEKHNSRLNDLTNQLKSNPNVKKSSSMHSYTSEIKEKPSESSIREKKAEIETSFRTNFLQLVLASLTKLCWPPALEPFSDPLNDLFYDPSTCHNAIAFILKVGVPRLNDELSRGSILESSIHSSPAKQLPLSTKEVINYELNKIGSQESLVEGFNLENSRPSSRHKTRSLLSRTSDSVSVISEKELSHITHNGSHEDSSLYNFEMRRPTSTPLGNYTTNRKEHNSPLPNDLGKLQKSYEMLLMQNQQLTRQHKLLKAYISNRSAIEDKLESIMMDFIQTVDSAQVASNKKQTYYTLSSLVSPEEDELFRNEIKKESEELERVSKQSLPKAGEKSSVGARKIGTKIKELTNSRGSTLLNESEKKDTNRSNIPEQDSVASSSQLSISQKKYNIDESCREKLTTHFSRWKEVRRDAQKCLSQSMGLSEETSFDIDNSISNSQTSQSSAIYKHPVFSSTAINIKTKNLLGIQNRKPTPPNTKHTDASENWLDQNKLVLLRHDLFEFALSSFQVAQEINARVPDLSLSYDKSNGLPTSSNSLKLWQNVDVMSKKSQDLLLHLSSYSPLMPLSSEDEATYSTTGLEDVLSDINQIISNSKGHSKTQIQAFERATDRARSEQANLVRSLTASRNLLTKWVKGAEHTMNTINTIRSRHIHLMKKVLKQVEGVRESASLMMKAYEEASKSKTSLDSITSLNSTRSSNQSIKRPVELSSLDQLSKGLLGEKVAGLVNSVKIYLDDLDSLKECTANVSSSLEEEMALYSSTYSSMYANLQAANSSTKRF